MKRSCAESGHSAERQSKPLRCSWTDAEDKLLLSLAGDPSSRDWAKIAKSLLVLQTQPGQRKTAKQCRERWHNKVDPNITSRAWEKAEEMRLFELYQRLGSRWSDIAAKLPGRTDNAVKNFFYCRLRKLARSIRKGVLADVCESDAATQNARFLLDHLRGYCSPEYAKSRLYSRCDKYVMGMAGRGELTVKVIDEYEKAFVAATHQLQQPESKLRSEINPKETNQRIGPEQGDSAPTQERLQCVANYVKSTTPEQTSGTAPKALPTLPHSLGAAPALLGPVPFGDSKLPSLPAIGFLAGSRHPEILSFD